MRIRYIPAVITLTAGTITCIISILKKEEVLNSLKLLLVVLIIFYIIGILARNIITYAIQMSTGEEYRDNKEEIFTQTENSNSIDEHSETGQEL